MAKNLVIVESPAKAKTIEGYLGKDFKVVSSYGHVRDLPKDDMAIDVKNRFAPTYEIPKDKQEVVKNLKKLVKDSNTIYLASDDDREGEAISWHLKEALDLSDERTRRIVFREITKNAILNAIKSPRNLDLDLINAQQARRILDRLVGFEISPLLWKKIKTGLSAGRVQSVAVRLVVEREREVDQFESQSFYKISAIFLLDKGTELKADLARKLKSLDEARDFLEGCKGAIYKIKSLEKKPATRNPDPPFTTSTLQQEASRRLGFSVSQTMSIAQRLYESGKISYMRTDSVVLSKEALASAKAQVEQSYGKEYVKTRQFKNKSKSAQEAHEAIRPTDFSLQKLDEKGNEQKLYDLIWKRSIASQMAEAKLERTVATISISTRDDTFTAQGEVVKFDGFLKVYIPTNEEDDQNEAQKDMLPPLTIGQELNLDMLKARQSFTKSPPRYTEATLVRKLEEMGIGRPSTYAPTITTIQKRGYVLKETRPGKEREYTEIYLRKDQISEEKRTEMTGYEKGKLFPTNIAMVVNDFLVAQFPNIIDFSFTATIEEELDDIAEGKMMWDKMIDEFYHSFHSDVKSTENLKRSEIGTVRELGTDPESGKKVYARMAKFGPVIQIGETDAEEKPRFTSLNKGQLIESITLEEGLQLFKLPRNVGEFEGEDIFASIGKFGPYVRHKSKFYSLGKDGDPLAVTLDEAIETIENKRKEDANRIIKVFDENPDFQILKGKWGPYLKAGRKNVRLPKDKKPEDLTFAECEELAKNAPEKSGRFKRGKK